MCKNISILCFYVYYKTYRFIYFKNIYFITLPLSCPNNSLGRDGGRVRYFGFHCSRTQLSFHHKFIQSIIQSPHFSEEVNSFAKGHLGQLWTNFTIRCSFYIYHTLPPDSAQFLIYFCSISSKSFSKNYISLI